MTDPRPTAAIARAQARKAAVSLGRLGLAARGVLYLLMGLVALLAAAHLQHARGPKGTLTALIAYPAGRALVLVLAAGFAAFAIAHLLALCIERRMDLQAWGRRIVALFLTGTYTSLTWFAVNLALNDVGGDDHATREHVGWLLGWPGGRIVLGLIALGIGGFGVFEVWRTVMRAPDALFLGARWTLRWLWRFGVAARGIVFVGVAILLLRVALDNDAREAGGVGAALRGLAVHPTARPMLLVIGVGLMVFGLVEMIAARRGSGGAVVEHAHAATTLADASSVR